MARPLRILYENAYYHVMNRGARRQEIFQNSEDYEVFLSTLEEAHRQFGMEIHAYCLMTNHYHLLIKTPKANLSRIMRHINGQYTQRYNRLKNTDGPLFRGRYKAILVDSDAYLLHLSKYIHLNPIEAEMVEMLEHYPWSSYPAYVAKSKPPNWLVREEIYSQLNCNTNKASQYKLFMNEEQNEKMSQFYNAHSLLPVLGDDSFINQLKFEHFSPEIPRRERVRPKATMAHIIREVSCEFRVSPHTLINQQKGPGRKNTPKKIAMYISQKFGDYRLIEIAEAFGLKHYGGVSNAIHYITQTLKTNPALAQQINAIIKRLDNHIESSFE